MNQLIIQEPIIKPAEVNFDKESVKAQLIIMLEPYQNIVVTQDTVKDAKKLVAEVRKKREIVDTLRKTVKKQLTQEVTLFEADIKDLLKTFDDAIEPIKEQIQVFTDRERAERTAYIQQRIEWHVDDCCLDEEFASKIVQDKKWMNATTSKKMIDTAIAEMCGSLQRDQEELEKGVAQIEQFIKMQNEANGMELMGRSYLRLLETKSVSDVIMIVTTDIANEVAKRKRDAEAKAEREQAERIEHAREILAKEREEIFAEEALETETPEIKSSPTPEQYEAAYDVQGTEDQLDKLEVWMTAEGIVWKEVQEDD